MKNDSFITFIFLNMQNPEKKNEARKGPIKPDKTRKNPGGLGFLKKKRGFASP